MRIAPRVKDFIIFFKKRFIFVQITKVKACMIQNTRNSRKEGFVRQKAPPLATVSLPIVAVSVLAPTLFLEHLGRTVSEVGALMERD